MTYCRNPDVRFCGNPSGSYVWVPLILAVASWAFSAYSTWNCNLVTLTDGQFIKMKGSVNRGAQRDMKADGGTAQVKYKATQTYITNAFGLFSFEDSSTSNYYNSCVAYIDLMKKDKCWITAIVFTLACQLLGLIIIIWLLLCTCFPIQPAHKTSLLALSVLAFICSCFSFLFYGNQHCKDFGCALGIAAIYQIIGAVLYLLIPFTMLYLKTTKVDRDSQQQEQHPQHLVDHQLIMEQRPDYEQEVEIPHHTVDESVVVSTLALEEN